MIDATRLQALRRATQITLAATLFVAAACSDSTGPSGKPSDPVEGTFALSSVNTKALPFALFSETDYKLEITKGTAALDTAGTFIISITTRETVAGNASTYADTTRGTFTQNVGVIGFMLTPGGQTGTATWDGNTLTFVETDGITSTTYVYRKNR